MSIYNPAFSSDEYDEKITAILPYYEDFYKQVSDILHCCFNGKISWLDLGCGTGKMAETAFREFSIERFVFCDISENMINIAKSRFKNMHSEFIVSPIQNIKFSEEFDVVTSIMVNHFLSDSERLLTVSNCFNSLKKNGLFISFENFAPFTQAGEKLFLERWKRFQIRNGKNLQDAENHINRYKKDYFPYTLSQIIELFKSSGFRQTEIFWLSNMQVGVIGIK